MTVWSFGNEVWGSSSLFFRVDGLGFRNLGKGFGAKNSRFRVEVFRFTLWFLGFRFDGVASRV